MLIRPAMEADGGAIWSVLEPVIRAGETNALPRDMGRDAALAYWQHHPGETFIGEQDGLVAGTYFIRPNQMGPGAHVANAGYMVAGEARGRGVARALCVHSLQRARALGYRAMQFNFVVSSNKAAVHLWTSCGFEVAGRQPSAFLHPSLGYVDALVMHRFLQDI